MTVSATATFDLDIIEVINDAYERAGVEVRTGYDMKTARRSLNLLFMEWANEGINLWTIEERSQVLTSGVASYTLEADTVDLLELTLRDTNAGSNFDRNLIRNPLADHARLAHKATTGVPNMVYVSRSRAAPMVTFYPVPDRSGYLFIYWAMRRMKDAGDYTNTVDVPFRFLPALVAGLAWRLAGKKQSNNLNLIGRLKTEYDEAFSKAADEDRDRSSLFIMPEVR